MFDWIIRANGTDKFVASPGLSSSYTRNRMDARRFPSREAALAECCGNETPERLHRD